MKPIDFPEMNCVAAKDQPEYLPLPILISGDSQGYAASCWKLTFWERLKILLTGKLWLEVMTFHRGIPPVKPSVTKPDFNSYGREE